MPCGNHVVDFDGISNVHSPANPSDSQKYERNFTVKLLVYYLLSLNKCVVSLISLFSLLWFDLNEMHIQFVFVKISSTDRTRYNSNCDNSVLRCNAGLFSQQRFGIYFGTTNRWSNLDVFFIWLSLLYSCSLLTELVPSEMHTHKNSFSSEGNALDHTRETWCRWAFGDSVADWTNDACDW